MQTTETATDKAFLQEEVHTKDTTSKIANFDKITLG